MSSILRRLLSRRGSHSLGTREGLYIPGDPPDNLQDLRDRTETADGENGALLDEPGKKNAGRSETLVPGSAAQIDGLANPNEELILSVKGSDEMATVVSVTLVNPILINVNPALGPGENSPVARIEWGVGGTQAQAFMDYMQGTQFSVPAAFLRVYARYEFGPNPDPPSGQLKLGAFVSYLSLKTNRTQLTRYASIADGASFAFVVPPFATDVIIFRQGVGAGANPFTADFVRGDGLILYTISVAAGALMAETHLANDVRTILVTNTGPDTAIFTAIFRLAL